MNLAARALEILASSPSRVTETMRAMDSFKGVTEMGPRRSIILPASCLGLTALSAFLNDSDGFILAVEYRLRKNESRAHPAAPLDPSQEEVVIQSQFGRHMFSTTRLVTDQI